MNQIQFDELSSNEIEQLIADGKVTREEVDERLQEAARREAAERSSDDLPDDTERTTAGGFGSGQGMGRERTGTGPDQPDERGEPRTEDRNWPY